MNFKKALPFSFLALPFLLTGFLVYSAPSEKVDTFVAQDSLAQISSESSDLKNINVDARLPVVESALEDIEKEGAEAEQYERLDLPESVNLDVPFTPQAPRGNWDLPYKEACEEASVIMAMLYFRGKNAISPQQADGEIVKLVQFVEESGYSIDMTAEETVEVINAYYGDEVEAELVLSFTADDIKRVLAEGNLVVMPFAGRQLDNPHFRAPGPLYHMLTVKGYNKNGFITNDPGTKFGSNFVYSYETIMSANHDWNNGNVVEGKKAMIVMRKK